MSLQCYQGSFEYLFLENSNFIHSSRCRTKYLSHLESQSWMPKYCSETRAGHRLLGSRQLKHLFLRLPRNQFDTHRTPKTSCLLNRRILPTMPLAPLKASAILMFQNPALHRPILKQQSQAQAWKDRLDCLQCSLQADALIH